MFGKSKEHYAAHFRVLLEGIAYESLQHFDEEFPGQICDFSQAEKKGWELAIRSVFHIADDEEISLETSYKCCRVHFQRSVTRVKSSHTLVPREKVDVFDVHIQTLMSHETTEEEFHTTVDAIRKQFPLLKNWINWYVSNNIT